MQDRDFWEQFKQTGHIQDYLSYTACTKEELDEESDRGGSRDKYSNADRNGSDRYAYR